MRSTAKELLLGVFLTIFSIISLSAQTTVDISASQKKVAENDAEVADHRSKIANLESEISKLESFVQRQKASLDKGVTVSDKLKEQLGYLQDNHRVCFDFETKKKLGKQIDDLRDTLGKVEDKKNQERADISVSEYSIKMKQKKIAEHNKKSKGIEASTTHLKKQIEYTKKYRADMDSRVGTGDQIKQEANAYLGG